MYLPRLMQSAALTFLFLVCAVPFAQPAAPKTKLTMSDARTIALTHESGTVKSGELEHEKGRWIYSFDIANATKTHEVNVDANTGQVVEDSLDTPAEEAKEAAADAKKGSAAPQSH